MGLRGPQPGTGGRPRKSLAEKVTEGNPGKRKLKVLDFEQIATEPEGVDMPPPKEFLSAVQRDGSTLSARELYEEAWAWLKRRGCAELVSPALLERYAVSAARWIHCEEQIRLSGQASSQLSAHTVALCRHESELHEADQSAVERDILHRP